MKGAGPHLQIIGLMEDAALISPVVMQCENEILEGHNRPCEVVKALSQRPGAREEANRNAWKLSSNNPSMIKELQRNSPLTLASELDGRMGCPPVLLCSCALDVILSSALLSEYLTNSLGIERTLE